MSEGKYHGHPIEKLPGGLHELVAHILTKLPDDGSVHVREFCVAPDMPLDGWARIYSAIYFSDDKALVDSMYYHRDKGYNLSINGNLPPEFREDILNYRKRELVFLMKLQLCGEAGSGLIIIEGEPKITRMSAQMEG